MKTQEFHLTQIAPSGMSADRSAKDANAAALAAMVRIGAGKRLAIRAFEAITRPLVIVLEWLG